MGAVPATQEGDLRVRDPNLINCFWFHVGYHLHEVVGELDTDRKVYAAIRGHQR